MTFILLKVPQADKAQEIIEALEDYVVYSDDDQPSSLKSKLGAIVNGKKPKQKKAQPQTNPSVQPDIQKDAVDPMCKEKGAYDKIENVNILVDGCDWNTRKKLGRPIASNSKGVE
jgi:hypothetical protein